MSALRIIRYAAWAGVAVVAALLAWTTVSWYMPRSGSSMVSNIAEVGGPFTLVDHTGKPVTEADLLGKPTVMFFGFTFCPEVCPTTLVEMQGWINQLGAKADGLNYFFVSVDPERDTQEVLASYLSAFDARIRGLTGTPEHVGDMVKAYRVFVRKVPLDKGDYTVDHTASVFLLDAKGNFVKTITWGEDPDAAIAKLRALVDGSA